MRLVTYIAAGLAALIAVAVLLASELTVAKADEIPTCSDASRCVTPIARQSVMIGPFSDGRVVWCRGRQDENGNLIISAQDAASCRMDTSDVKIEPYDPCRAVQGDEAALAGCMGSDWHWSKHR